jgi:hypothetical protein
MFTDGFNHDFRCVRCGCRYGDHKGGTDNNGSSGACPPTTVYGYPVPTPYGAVLDDPKAADKAFWHYWHQGAGTFKPIE